MQKLQTPIRIGDRVRLRGQRWRVVEVRSHDACQLLTLTGLGPLNAGKERRVLTPFDVVESLAPAERLRIVGLPRWRRRCRDWLGENRAAGDLQTAQPARIDLLPHQLEPVLALVRGRGSRVLLADAVGLGKTIQAGLIVAELRARGAADRVLILTPAGLRDQWATELSERFDLGFTIVDMGETRRRATELPIGLNPWSTMPSVIASIDYVKRPEVLPALLACRWDVVVVDEAHAATRGTDRYHAVSSLCQRTPVVVLLTATPHNGDRAAFESLCALGSLDDRLLVFRRDRHDVALGAGRRVHRVAVASTREELHTHQLLARFTNAVRNERGDDPAAWLALTTLHKRALSSARSLEETIERRLAGLPTSAAESFRQMSLPLADPWGELDSSDEAPLWASPALDDVDRERRMLGRLAAAARAAASHESKLGRLARLLRRLERHGEPAIVFTEYRDTLAHVQQTLPAQCAVLHGGLTRDQRRTALEDFQRGRRTLLLATDAGSEGLNLHQGCRVVINLELPWNPMRLEQRIGRVDRIGQMRRVHAFNLIARDTGEMQLFERLKMRVARARQDIGAADPLDTMRDDDEPVAARLVMGAASDEGTSAAPSGGDARATRAFVSFTTEAAAERSRLLDARRLASVTARSEHVDLDAETWIAFARRPITRMRLARRLLVLLQSLVEDGCGRIVSVHVTPLVIRTSLPIGRLDARRAIAAIRFELQRHAFADAVEARWEVDRRVHADFWETRLMRERAIAGDVTQADAGAGVFQPGLFDRRAERQHDTSSEMLETASHDARQYIDSALRAAVVEVRPYRAALFLVS